MTNPPHTFHIPVMGTGFTIDTPLKVARYGISSVISLVDDVLIEQMRKFHCGREGEPYEEIPAGTPDARALRITAYLDLVDRLVRAQSKLLQAGAFEPGSEITRYFEMLPESPLKRDYRRMLSASDPAEKAARQEALRPHAVPGSIDVNIMTKLDRNLKSEAEDPQSLLSDAMSALRGYARSKLESAIVFSAGMNQRLYGYAAQFADFLPAGGALPRKSIILKVGDYRSAEIQGKYLAKRGLWVSEYRIESGLNCGGHAFPNQGRLLGPILEEFKRDRDALVDKLLPLYRKALAARGIAFDTVPPVRVTVQGGIGTAEEDRLLRERYGVDGTGWGTPFLLVPEATNVDDFHLNQLARATERDVYLSDSSPLGVPFWMLRTSKSEEARRERILQGRPGTPCPKGYLASNTEFTPKPICTASYAYQKLKLDRLSEEKLSPEQREERREAVLAKACICNDLAGSATVKYGVEPQATTTVCCGPNIASFSRIASLAEMADHIYGRAPLPIDPGRKHLFVRELELNAAYLRRRLRKAPDGNFAEFERNLAEGAEYYRVLSREFTPEVRQRFLGELEEAEREMPAVPAPA